MRFHDGHELTARTRYTYETSWIRNQPRRGAARFSGRVGHGDRSYTIEFVLKADRFVSRQSGRGPHSSLRCGRELRASIGTGPYQFVRYLSMPSRFESVPDYFEGLPRNRGVVLKVVPDDIMRALELRKRTADLVVNDMAPDMAYQLQKEGMQLHRFPGSNYQYLF